MKKILKSLCFVILIVLTASISLSIYVKSNYGISIINTYKQLTKLNEKVDEDKLCDHRYTKEDVESCKKILNSATDVVVSEKDGKIVIDFSSIKNNIKDVIRLSDKECAAIAESNISEKQNGKITVGNIEMDCEIMQIKFFNIIDGCADINLIAKTNFVPLKEKITQFPINLLKNNIPNTIYLSSTIRVNKTPKAFEYTIESKDFTINNLNVDETNKLLNTINKFYNIGTATDFNQLIGNEICNALIGNEDNEGLAYSLKKYGAKDFSFEYQNNCGYFVIERETIISLLK